jgi:hypothetical protein
MEFSCYCLLGPIIEERALHREIIRSSMDISIVICEVSRYGVDHLFRLLCTGCRVEIDEIRMCCEYREVWSEHKYICYGLLEWSCLTLYCCDLLNIARSLDTPVCRRILISYSCEYRKCLNYIALIEHARSIF